MDNERMAEISSAPLSGLDRLPRIAAQLRAGERVEPVTVRELLSWFGAQRRGSIIAFVIRDELAGTGLVTKPDFYEPYIDGLVEFHLVEEASGPSPAESPADAAVISFPGAELKPDEKAANSRPFTIDPTYRIGRLRANVTPTCVSPNSSIKEAITIMLANDFSQLPVMVGEREVKGVVSWSSIGRNLALGAKCNEVRECMDAPRIVNRDASLFDTITEIVNNQYVLIRDQTNKISGIVTTSDLSLEFQLLTEPFLLLAEIENHVRSMIHNGNFGNEELSACCDLTEGKVVTNGIFDLDFGDYIRLMGKEECWLRLKLNIDKSIFINYLDKVRKIRNNVMHFDPDGLTGDDLDALRKFVGFLQKLQPMLSTNETPN